MEKVYGSSFRANLKEYMNKAEEQPLLIERRDSDNLVLLSEKEYNRLFTEQNQEKMLDLEIEQKVDQAIVRRLLEFEKLIKKREEDDTTGLK